MEFWIVTKWHRSVPCLIFLLRQLFPISSDFFSNFFGLPPRPVPLRNNSPPRCISTIYPSCPSRLDSSMLCRVLWIESPLDRQEPDYTYTYAAPDPHAPESRTRYDKVFQVPGGNCTHNSCSNGFTVMVPRGYGKQCRKDSQFRLGLQPTHETNDQQSMAACCITNQRCKPDEAFWTHWWFQKLNK